MTHLLDGKHFATNSAIGYQATARTGTDLLQALASLVQLGLDCSKAAFDSRDVNNV
jgi:hypothetical protein